MESLFRWRFIHESSRAVTTERGAVSESHGKEDEHARHDGTSSSGIGRARLDIGRGGGRVDGFVGIDADDADAGSGGGHAGREQLERQRARCAMRNARDDARQSACCGAWFDEMTGGSRRCSS